MSMLTDTLVEGFCQRFDAFVDQAGTLSAPLTEDEFWTRPFAYGNSVGHLLLHVTGNLNHFIGTAIAQTGYVRQREVEFADATRRPKVGVLEDLAAAVEMVKATIRMQSADDWSAPYAAVGSDERTRFGIVLRCTHHFHHHLGQIIYLSREHLARRDR